MTSLKGKVCIVTGANTGVGKQTAINLCAKGADVIIGCRSLAKGVDAQRDIKGDAMALTSEPGMVHFIPLDLADFKSVRLFVDDIFSRFPQVDILINNAGLNTNGVTSAALTQLFQVNYLGHYLLTRLLINRLKRKSDIDKRLKTLRVVNLSSVMHHAGQPDFEKSSLPGLASSCYADSKLYLNYLTMEINKRYSTSSSSSGNKHEVGGIIATAVSVNPGAVRSDIWRGMPRLLLWVFDLVMRAIFLDVRQGCATSVFGAEISTEELQSHGYFPSDTSGSFSLSSLGSRSSPSSTSLSLTSTSRSVLGSAVEGRSSVLCRHPLVPYITPYNMKWPYVVLDAIGYFAGPTLGFSTFPMASSVRGASSSLSSQSRDINRAVGVGKRNGVEDSSYSTVNDPNNMTANESILWLSAELWDYSEKLCRRILEVDNPPALEL